jgi:hypothetical protein
VRREATNPWYHELLVSETVRCSWCGLISVCVPVAGAGGTTISHARAQKPADLAASPADGRSSEKRSGGGASDTTRVVAGGDNGGYSGSVLLPTTAVSGVSGEQRWEAALGLGLGSGQRDLGRPRESLFGASSLRRALSSRSCGSLTCATSEPLLRTWTERRLGSGL